MPGEPWEHDCEALGCASQLVAWHHYWYMHPRAGLPSCEMCVAASAMMRAAIERGRKKEEKADVP